MQKKTKLILRVGLCLLITNIFNAQASNQIDRIVFNGQARDYNAFKNGDIQSSYSDIEAPTTVFDYQLEFWTLLGEPIINCTSVWRIEHASKIYHLNTKLTENNSRAIKASEIKGNIRPWDVNLLIPVGGGLKLFCDPGVTSNSENKNSFNTPESPDWEHLFLSNDFAHNRKKVVNENLPYNTQLPYNSNGWFWLTADEAKSRVKLWLNELSKNRPSSCPACGLWVNIKYKESLAYVNLGYGYLATATNVKYDLSDLYGLIKGELVNQNKSSLEVKNKKVAKDKIASNSSSLDDMFMAQSDADLSDFSFSNGIDQLYENNEKKKQIVALSSFSESESAKFHRWKSKKEIEIKNHKLPSKCSKEQEINNAAVCINEKCGYRRNAPYCYTPDGINKRFLCISDCYICGSSAFKSAESDYMEHRQCVAENTNFCENKACISKKSTN